MERLRATSPEAPGRRIARLRDEVGAATAHTLVTGGLDSLWSDVHGAGVDATTAANVIANNLVGAGVDPALVNASELAKLIAARDVIPRKIFDDAVAHAGDDGFVAAPYLAQKAVADVSELEPIIERVLASNAAQVEQYRAGKTGLLGFFVGQVMKETNGGADARAVNELLRAKLEA